MAYGDSQYDERLYSEWSDFCDKLKEAGKFVFKDANPPTALQRVDGFRYLTQNLSQAFEFALEARNTKYPIFVHWCTPLRKLGMDNADCVYLFAWIDGESVYKISGKKGTAKMWNIGVQGPRDIMAYGHPTDRILHEPLGDPPEAHIFGDELVTNWDGTFELYIGGEPQGQNWLPSTKGTRSLFLRQYFDSWDEEVADYRIERIGMNTPRPIPTPDEMAEAMRWAATFAYEVVEFWPEWVWSSRYYSDPDNPNRFNSPPSLDDMTTDKMRGRVAAVMWWRLKQDEAIVLEFDDPRTFWQITSEGVFGNSMDFLYRNVSYTPSRTAVDPDGKIRFAFCAEDPGFHNWIDNQGYEAGNLTFRNMMSNFLPEFKTTVVKLSDVPQHMHAGSPRVTPGEREQQLKRRFDAIRKRYTL